MSGAFGNAWRLLKMPLLPESVKRDENKYSAIFQHPKTKVNYPMRGEMHFDPELHEAHFGSNEEHQERNSVGKPWISEVSIENPPDIDDGEIVGHSVFGASTRDTGPVEYPGTTPSNLEEWAGSPHIPARSPFTPDKKFRGWSGEEPPVGMGSAMYDLGAIMGDDHGVRIVPSSARSEQALNMWAKNEDRGYWPSPSPVQTGEPMDIAYQLIKEEDFQLHDADGNLHPDYVECPTCNGQGFRDEYSGDREYGGEQCYHCFGHGVVHRTEEENRPIDDLMGEMVANPTPETMQPVREYFAPDKPERVFPEGFQDVMTGEPMDLAFRLLKGDDRHTLPEGVYSPKNVDAYVEEHKGELGGLARLHTTDHFYDQAVNRGLIPLKYHRGKMQQIQKGKGNIFNPTGTRGGVNTVGYIQNVIKLFLHQHGISHPSQLPADGIGIHLGDRGGDIFHDKTKEYRMSHDGYTPIVAQRKNHPDEFALTTVYGDEDSPHADKPLKGRTYSLFDENPHRGEKYKSEPLQPNFRIPIMSRKGSVDSDANTHMITEPALGFLKEHFGSDEHLHHNGNPLLKFTKPRGGDGGHRVDWAGGGLPKDGWNIGMEKTAGSIGSALQELQTNYQLGMTEDPDALDALGGDMFQAWKGVHDAKGAEPWDYNSITMPENTPGWFGGDDALKGTPFEIAWQLLKFLKLPKMRGRQTTLPEFSANMTSPHGPVKYYHGTSGDRVPGIHSQGLQPNQGKVWVSQKRGVADNYAGGRSANRFLDEVMQPGGNLASPTQKPTTFGIREAAGDPNQHMGMSSFDKTVQPEHLVRMPPTQKPADPEWHTGKPQTGTGAQGQ